MEQKKRIRFKYFIDPSIQMGIIIYCLLISGFILIVSRVLLFSVASKMQNYLVDLNLPPQIQEQSLSFMTQLRTDIEFYFILSTMIAIFVTICFGMIVSHRIAGPIYNIRKNFAEMAEKNDLHRIKFRETDYFKDIESSFNRIVENQKKTNP